MSNLYVVAIASYLSFLFLQLDDLSECYLMHKRAFEGVESSFSQLRSSLQSRFPYSLLV